MYEYLRILPQRSEIVVKNNSCAGLPLPVFDDKRRVDHVKNDKEEQPQCFESGKEKDEKQCR
jgi:hypothetical protein